MKKNKRQKKQSSPLIEALEPRILFSADVFGGAVDNLSEDDPTASLLDQTVAEHDRQTLLRQAQQLADESTTLDTLGDTHDTSLLSTDSQADTRIELVLIDTNTPNYQQILDDLTSQDDEVRQFNVILLDANSDGVSQVTQILDSYSELDAVHIISHGSDGQLELGNTTLSQSSLPAYDQQIQNWSLALDGDADILIYGCDLAASEDGQRLVDALSRLTGADVAASDDLTGSTSLGGDWELEFNTGSIETDLFISAQGQAAWQHVLGTVTFQQGDANGYSGTLDTELDEINDTANHGGNLSLGVDLDSSGGETQGLIRFDGIVGSDPGDVPQGVQITSASLTVEVTNTGGDIRLYQMLDTWDESSNWLDFGGLTVGGELASSFDAQISGDIGTKTFTGLEATVQGWVDGENNYGWGLLATSTDGWDMDTSEGTVAPILSVTYIDPGSQASSVHTLTVDTASDEMDGDTSSIDALLANRGFDGSISLREAIWAANNTTNVDASTPDVINFAIGAEGSQQTIALTNTLPAITDALVLDALTQGGIAYSGNPLIEIDVSGSASSATAGILIWSSDTTVRGFSVTGSQDEGIEIAGSSSHGAANNNLIEHNWVGLDLSGAVAANADNGILIVTDASNNIIRNNVVAGNTDVGIEIRGTGVDANIVQGNYVGLLADGVTAQANGGAGIRIAEAATNTQIGGTGLGEGNIISGNTGGGLVITGLGTDGNIVQGNYFGTDAAGTASKNNTGNNIDINTGASNNIIGGGAANAGNTIAFASNDGITIWGSSTSGNTIQGNFIGTDSAGTLDLGNSNTGIVVSGGATDTLIGGTDANEGNLIFHNDSTGLEIRDVGTLGNTALRNLYFDNTGSGIDLGGDGVTNNDANDTDNGNSNDRQNFPVITAAELNGSTLTLSGSLDTDGVTTQYRIEFYGNAAGAQDTTNGEGRFYLGATNVTTNGSGDATFNNVLLNGVSLSEGDFITATATKITNPGQVGTDDQLAYGDTSEFAANFAMVDPNDAPVAVDDFHGLDFDGVDDYVLIADSASLTMTNTMTIETWVKADTTANASQIILNKEGEYELGLDVDGNLRWAFANSDPSWSWHNTGYVIDDGTWAHIAVSYDNGTVSSYVNGTLVDVYNGSGAIGDAHPTLDELRIGGRSNNPAGQYFDGQIDEVRIWNTARSGNEILANIDATLLGNEAGLAGYWQFNEGSGTTVNDLTANANNGTLIDGGAGTVGPQWTGYSTDQNTQINISAANGIVANDIDNDGDPLTVTQVEGSGANVGSLFALSSGANLTVGTLGAFIYNPNGAFDNLSAGETAVDTFTYQVSDGNGGFDTATVSITITGTNDAPVLTGDLAATVAEAGTYTLLAGDLGYTDPDDVDPGVTFTTSSYSNGKIQVSGVDATSFTGTQLTAGVVTFVHDGSETNSAAFDVNVEDGNEDSSAPVNSTFNFTVTAVNDNDPVITSDGGGATAALNVFENGLYVTTVTATDADLPAETITYSLVGGLDQTKFTINGSTGVLRFQAAPDYENPTDNGLNNVYDVVVQASDGTRTDTQAIAVTVVDVSDSGQYLDLFNADAYNNSDGNQAWTNSWVDSEDGDATSGDIKAIDGELRITTTSVNDNIYRQVDLSTATSASYSFTANNSLTGARTVLVQVSGDGGSNYDTLAVMDASTNTGTGSYTFDISSYVASDTQIRFLVSAVGGSGPGGNLLIDNVEVSYVANIAPTVNATASDSGTEDIDQVYTHAEMLALIGASDADDANSALSVAISNVANGSVALTGGTGGVGTTFTFTPTNNFAGNLTFDYQVSDDQSPTPASSAVGTATVTLTEVNDAPAGADKTVTTNEDTDYGFTAADFGFSDSSDSPADDLLNVIITTAPANGTLYLDSNNDGLVGGGEALADAAVVSVADINAGRLKFKPVSNANGTAYDSFTFQVQDDGGTTNSGVDTDQSANTITIDVTAQADPASIGGDTTAAVSEDGTLSDTGALTISDPDAGEAVFNTQTAAASTSGYGTVDLDAAGNWTYNLTNANATVQALSEGETLADSFTATSADGSTQVVTVTITGKDDAAVIGGDTTAAVSEDGTLSDSGALTISDTDDGEAVFVTQTTAASTSGYGTVDLDAAGNWTYSLNNANATVQALSEGETLADSFTATSADGSTQVISVTITGKDDAAVIGGDTTAAVSEDGTLSDGGALTISDTDDGEDVFVTQTTAASTSGYGTVDLDAAGNWTYSLNNANATVQALSEGETLADSFTATSADGSTQVVTVTITGKDDAAVLGGDTTAAVSEDGTLSDSGALTISDTDDGEDVFVTQTTAASTSGYGTVDLDAAGNWTYSLNNANATVQALSEGETLADSFTATSADGSTQVVSITITGKDDAAVIGGDTTAAVSEDGTLSDSGALTISDTDDGEDVFVTQTTAASTSGYGTVDLDAAGNWTYSLNNANATVQALSEGETLADSFTAISADGSTQVVTVTITGKDDAAVIGGDTTATVSEDGTLSDSGALTISDTDDGEDVFTAQTSAASTSGYGTVDLDAAGNWTYSLNNANATVQALSEGETLADSFTATSADGSTQVVTVTITGKDDVAVIGGDTTAAVSEDGTLSDSGALTITDTDDGEDVFTAQTSAASTSGYGTVDLDAAGNWTYSLNNANATVQALSEGETLADSFTATSADGSTQVVTVTITGKDDAAVIGGDTTAAVSEDGTLSDSGALTISDTDDGEDVFVTQTTAASTSGYGTVDLDAAGNWTYSLNNANATVQALSEGETLADSFTATSADGSTQVVSVTITGKDDAAVIGGDTTAAVSEDGTLSDSGALTITDTDDGEAVFVTQTTAASTSGYGTVDLDSAGNWTYNLNNAHATVQALSEGETLADSFTATSADGSTQVVSVTITGKDDAAVIGGDTTAAVSEDGTLTDTGALTISDTDDGEAVFTSQSSAASTSGYGTVDLDAAGNWTYSLNNANATVQALSEGETLADSFTATSADGSTQVVTVTITGKDDAPVFGGDTTAAVTEEDVLSDTGTLTISDTDDGEDVFVAQTAAASTNGYGTVDLDAAGNWTYNLTNSNATVQALSEGETLADSFTATSADGSTQVVTVTITGKDDAPVFGGDTTAAVTEEDVLSDTGTFTISDTDDGEDVFVAQTAAASTNGYGTVDLDAAGNWTYNLTNANPTVQALSEGETLADSFTATSADGSTQVVTVTITGKDDAPVFGGDTTATVTEEDVLSDTGTLTISDTDDGEDVFVTQTTAASTSGYGTVDLDAAGNWTYSLNNAHATVQALSEGETLADSFTATSADGSTQVVSVTITGKDDAAVIGGDTTAAVSEDGTLTDTGALTISDTDDGEDVFVTQATAASTSGYGTVDLDAAGNWTYSLNNAHATVQALSEGETLADSFTATSADGSTQVVSVTITGKDDAAVIGGDITAAVSEDGTLSDTGTLTISDTDDGEDVFVTQTTAASTSGYGTVDLDAAGNWTYNLTNANATIQALSEGETLADSFTATSADGTTQVVTVTITGKDDAPVIGGDITAAVSEDGTLSDTGTLTISDTDDGEDVFVTQTTAASTSGYGTVDLDAVGNWTYSLNNAHATVQALSEGETLADSFTTTSADGSTQVVSVTITGSNDLPVAENNTVTIIEDTATALSSADFTFSDIESEALVSVHLNNLNLNGGTLTHSGGISVSNGDVLTASELDTLIYTPPANANGFGFSSMDFSVNDTGNGITRATLTLDVTAVNDAPIAIDNTVLGSEDSTKAFTLADFSYTDIENNSASGVQLTNINLNGGSLTHSGGTVVNNGDVLDVAAINSLVYAPPANANGTNFASFDYSINDADLGTATATMTIDIEAVNDAPVASDALIIPDADNRYTFNTNDFNFSDIDNDSLSGIELTALSTTGELQLNGNTVGLNQIVTSADIEAGYLTYTPGLQFYTDESANFTYRVYDGITGSEDSYAMVIDLFPINNIIIDSGVEKIPPPQEDSETNTQEESTNADSETKTSVEEGVNLDLSGIEKLTVPSDLQLDTGENGDLIIADVINIELAELKPLSIKALTDLFDKTGSHDEQVKKVPIATKFIDLNNLDITPYEVDEVDVMASLTLADNDAYIQELDKLRFDLDKAAEQNSNEYASGAEARLGITVSLSAGFVSWALRAGSLFASAMSVMPLWRQLDLLPIVGTKSKKENEANQDAGQTENSEAEINTTSNVENIFRDDRKH